MASELILVIEDEPALVEVLSYNLEREGYQVLAAHDGQSGLSLARSSRPQLIILDLMLPLMDGLDVCRQLRSERAMQRVPILMLTAKGEEFDEVAGFQLGADDYVTKPFKVKPLLQRIKALLRRSATEDERESLALYGLQIDRWRHRATLDGRELRLTPTEFRLLWSLARQPGRAFRRNELMDASLGEDAVSLERTIDVHVKSLRQKLTPRSDLIETVRGIGYRFRDDRQIPATGQASSL